MTSVKLGSDDARVASEVDAAQDFVILASFENRRAAERVMASLGRGFRKKHRKGHVTALVISGKRTVRWRSPSPGS